MLDPNIDPIEDILSAARAHARDGDDVCRDVAANIFPAAIHPASEATISAVSVKLRQIVADLETTMVGNGAANETWPMLARSGFLREPNLVDFALARVAEDRVDAQLELKPPSLVSTLLDHPNQHVTHAARALVAADSLHRRSDGKSFLAMPPELLHKTVWRVVAALEVAQGTRSPAVIDAARNIIARYDEAATAPVAARKIVHFVGDEMRHRLLDPVDSGVHLFAAQLSAAAGIDHDHVLRIIDLESALPFIVVLASAAVSKPTALALVLQVRAQKLTSREAHFLDRSYDKISSSDAAQEIAAWVASRSMLLNWGLT